MSTTQSASGPDVAACADALDRVVFEVKRVIVGQERLVERLLVSLLARGHCLLEGVPGVAKTLAVETLAQTVSGSFSRLQFTPDLVPSDIVGTRIYRAGAEQFDTELGPIMANFVLADEINRAPAKVQSALLEVMAEQHVTIGGKRYDVPKPFLVLATQNPIESEGVYPLPEAQRDRFLMKIEVGYPTTAEEREIVYRMGSNPPTANMVLSLGELSSLQAAAGRVFVHHAIVDYVVRLVVSSRQPAVLGLHDVEQWISYGASPRATLGLVAAGRALALMRGRDYVLPQDVLDVAVDVMAHRLVRSYDAIADGVPASHAVQRLLQAVPLPQVAPRLRGPGGGFGPPPGPMQGPPPGPPIGPAPAGPGGYPPGPPPGRPLVYGTAAPGTSGSASGYQPVNQPGSVNQPGPGQRTEGAARPDEGPAHPGERSA